MSTKGALKEKSEIKLKEPKKYNVIMHNDDFTTMDFVVEVLEDVFNKTPQEAENLMLTVHNCGKAVVGCYPYDIAKTKVAMAMTRAKTANFPFKVTMEEA